MKVSLITLALTAVLCSVPAHGVPITRFVTVDGNDWAQVADFSNLSWYDIHFVCGGGGCGVGELNGLNMLGWTWANVGEVNGLFNSYLAAAGVSPSQHLVGARSHTEADSSWAPSFIADFEPFGSNTDDDRVQGLMRAGLGPFSAPVAFAVDFHDVVFPDLITTLGSTSRNASWSTLGGWFYRSALPYPVPLPSTFFLLALGMLGLRLSRLRNTNRRGIGGRPRLTTAKTFQR